MKNIVVLFMLILISYQNSIAQFTQAPDKPNDRFSVREKADIIKKGAWYFDLNHTPVNVGIFSNSSDGDKTGNSFNIRSHLEANYFLVNGFGVGAGINSGFSKRTQIVQGENDIINKSTSWGIIANVLYGRTFGKNFTLISKLSLGYDNEIYKTINSETTTNKQNSLTTKITLEAPVRLTRYIYFAPYVGYENRQSWEENYNYSKNAFIAGGNLNFYMGCGDDYCDCSGDPVPYDERYQKGDITIGSKTFASFLTGVKKETYKDEGDYTQKDGLTRLHVDGYALYNVINNLGVGGGIDVGWNNTGSKDYDYSQSSLETKIKAILRYNFPFNNSLKNIYAETSYGYGFSNRKTDNAGNVTKDNSTVSSFYAGGGYIYHINEQLSLNLSAGYLNTSRKNKDDDTKNKRSGFDAGVGIEYIINARKDF